MNKNVDNIIEKVIAETKEKYDLNLNEKGNKKLYTIAKSSIYSFNSELFKNINLSLALSMHVRNNLDRYITTLARKDYKIYEDVYNSLDKIIITFSNIGILKYDSENILKSKEYAIDKTIENYDGSCSINLYLCRIFMEYLKEKNIKIK